MPERRLCEWLMHAKLKTQHTSKCSTPYVTIWERLEAMAGRFERATMGQSAGLTETGMDVVDTRRTVEDMVGQPCCNRLLMSQKGLIKLDDKTLALPVWAKAKDRSSIAQISIICGDGFLPNFKRGSWCSQIRSRREVMPNVIHWYICGKA